jgi:CDP-4-dehydro-6-deoxyglucose reductase
MGVSDSPSASGALLAALDSRTVIAPGIVDLEFAMRDPARLTFRAGQFVSFLIGKDGLGGTLKRSYSIASPSHQGDRLRFIIRVIPDGAASEFVTVLPIGGEVRMTGPHGFFVLDAEHPGDIVMGATGTGASALMPMLGELERRSDGGDRFLHWGARHEEDLFARREIEDLCRKARSRLSISLTDPPPGWTGARGRITQAIVDQLPGLTAPTYYLVGNGSMISDLKTELCARGVNRKQQIRTEAFFD